MFGGEVFSIHVYTLGVWNPDQCPRWTRTLFELGSAALEDVWIVVKCSHGFCLKTHLFGHHSFPTEKQLWNRIRMGDLGLVRSLGISLVSNLYIGRTVSRLGEDVDF